MISDQLSLRQRLDQDGPFKSFDRWLNEAVEFTCSKEPNLPNFWYPLYDRDVM